MKLKESKYRIVTIGDIHLKRVDALGIISKEGLNTRLLDRLAALKYMIDYAIKIKATHIVFLGDIFESVNPSETLRELFWQVVAPAIAEFIQIRILVGNHDTNRQIYNLAGDTHILPKNVKILPECSEEALELAEKKQLNIEYIPYVSPEDTAAWLTKKRKKDPDIVFGHFEIMGAELAPDNAKIRTGFDKDLVKGRLIWLGHIHKFQEIRKAFAYIGSIVKCDFGERNNKKVFGVIEVKEDGKMDYNYFEIPQREMIQVDVNETDVANIYAAKEIPPEINKEGALVKVVFKGSWEWLKTISETKFKRRFTKVMVIQTDSERTDYKKPTMLLQNKTLMVDHVHTYVKEKKKGKEYLEAGMAIATEAQSID